ncbi:MAG: undecaprenyl-phosphate galactose phosphotransferase, partial [Planctomycetota bacterium]
MSATISACDAVLATDADFATVVANYAKSEELPSATWLKRLELERPQTHLRSIDRWTQQAKRMLDLFCAAAMLVLLAPVMLLVALAVRLTSPGPILFRQIRTGLNLRTSRDRRADRADAAGDERRQKSN